MNIIVERNLPDRFIVVLQTNSKNGNLFIKDHSMDNIAFLIRLHYFVCIMLAATNLLPMLFIRYIES